MKFDIEITDITTIEEIENAWSNQDYINLLKLFDFEDAEQVAEKELLEMLSLAMSDFDPPDAAEIVLQYKLGDQLTEGQIQNIAHEMMDEKIAEEYPDISLHHAFF